MDNFSFLVLDSGVGGISVFATLLKAFPDFDFYYASDKKDLPFGSKNADDLLNIAVDNAKRFSVKDYGGLILACNTLSCVAGEYLKSKLNMPVFGVFPKRGLKGKTLLLCTKATANSAYVKGLGCCYTVAAMPQLATDVERNIFNIANVDLSALPMGEYDNVLLGCTHYIFLKERLKSIYKTAKFFDGREELVRSIEQTFFARKTPNREKTQKIRVLRDHFLGCEKDENYAVFCKYYSN